MTAKIDIAAVRNSCLQHHNTYRAAHKSPALTRGATLDETAQRWAERLAATGKFEHSDDAQRNGAGENIYVSYTTATTPPAPDALAKEAVKCWYDEVAKYDYTKGQFDVETGHFTQVVWKGSTQLGTGVAFGTVVEKGKTYNATYVVCQYSPAGNMSGSFAANVLKP